MCIRTGQWCQSWSMCLYVLVQLGTDCGVSDLTSSSYRPVIHSVSPVRQFTEDRDSFSF